MQVQLKTENEGAELGNKAIEVAVGSTGSCGGGDSVRPL